MSRPPKGSAPKARHIVAHAHRALHLLVCPVCSADALKLVSGWSVATLACRCVGCGKPALVKCLRTRGDLLPREVIA